MTRIRLAVLGYGNLSSNTYFPLLHSFAHRVEMCGLVEPDGGKRERAESIYRLGGAYASVDELLEAGEPDAALVLIPAAAHGPVIRQLLEAGVDVYTEKPDTHHLAEARELVELAQDKGRIYQVGQNRLFMTALRRVKAFFGETDVDFIHVEKSKFVETADSAYFLDDGIHVISPMLWLAGDVARVIGATHIPGRLLSAHFELASGGAATLTQHVDAGHWVERFLVHGGKKSARVESPDLVETFEGGHQVGDGLVGRCPLLFDPQALFGWKEAVGHFLDCVESREEPIGSAESLLRVHELMNEVFRAAGLPEL